MNNTLYLYEIDPNRRYWVIRSGRGGEYVDHFRKSGVTAIGHADEYIPSNFFKNEIGDENGRYYLSKEQCNKIIGDHLDIASRDNSVKKGQAANINGQIRRFLNEVKVNDIVVTVSANEVMSGRILSKPYFCSDLMKISNSNNEESSMICSYSLRRDVIWARRYKRETIPYVLENSFRNVSTIFEVSSSDKKSILNHWLSPAHISGDTLHLSSRIESKRSIGNRSMTQLSCLLDKLELLSYNIAESLEKGKSIDSSAHLSYLNKSNDYDYLLTTQQAFMSPGDHFIQLSTNKLQLKVYAILFASLFNTELVLADDQKGEIDENNKQSIMLIAKKVGADENFEKIQQDLNLKLKKPDDKVMNSNQPTDDQFPESEKSNKTPI